MYRKWTTVCLQHSADFASLFFWPIRRRLSSDHYKERRQTGKSTLSPATDEQEGGCFSSELTISSNYEHNSCGQARGPHVTEESKRQMDLSNAPHPPWAKLDSLASASTFGAGAFPTPLSQCGDIQQTLPWFQGPMLSPGPFQIFLVEKSAAHGYTTSLHYPCVNSLTGYQKNPLTFLSSFLPHFSWYHEEEQRFQRMSCHEM